MPERAHREGDEQRAQRRQKAGQTEAGHLKARDESPEATADVSPLEGQAAILSDGRFSHPANAGQKAQVASHLQRSHGNAYVQRLLDSKTVQAKLTVNPPDDQYEREADRVAEAVSRAPDTGVQRQEEEEKEEGEAAVQAKPAAGHNLQGLQRQVEEGGEEEEVEEEAVQTKPAVSQSVHTLQRQVEEGEEEEEEEEATAQTKPVAARPPKVSRGLERRIDAARGGGRPLGDSVRAPLENQFERDLSQVHVHTDHEADSLSRELQASAFTSGRDVFFRQGAYDPHSQAGMGLLGHEVTHVVQQGAAGPDRSQPVTGSPPVQASPLPEAAAIQRQGAAREEEEEPWWLKKGITAKRGVGIDKKAAAEKLGSVNNTARVNAVSFSDEVGKACDHFEVYAKPRISALKGELTAGELVSSLLSAALGPLRQQFTERVATVLGEKVTAAVTGKFDTAVKDAAKKVVANESDVKALEDAVAKACAGAKDAATRLKDAVGENLTPAIDATQRRLYEDLPLTEAQDEMVGMFYEAPVRNVDDYLERFYGVPSKAKARTLQVQVYYHLVRRFEEKVIEAEWPMDFEERLRKRALKGHIASERALRAAEERRKALEGE